MNLLVRNHDLTAHKRSISLQQDNLFSQRAPISSLSSVRKQMSKKRQISLVNQNLPKTNIDCEKITSCGENENKRSMRRSSLVNAYSKGLKENRFRLSTLVCPPSAKKIVHDPEDAPEKKQRIFDPRSLSSKENIRVSKKEPSRSRLSKENFPSIQLGEIGNQCFDFEKKNSVGPSESRAQCQPNCLLIGNEAFSGNLEGKPQPDPLRNCCNENNSQILFSDPIQMKTSQIGLLTPLSNKWEMATKNANPHRGSDFKDHGIRKDSQEKLVTKREASDKNSHVQVIFVSTEFAQSLEESAVTQKPQNVEPRDSIANPYLKTSRTRSQLNEVELETNQKDSLDFVSMSDIKDIFSAMQLTCEDIISFVFSVTRSIYIEEPEFRQRMKVHTCNLSQLFVTRLVEVAGTNSIT